MISQTDQILAHMEAGNTITPLQSASLTRNERRRMRRKGFILPWPTRNPASFVRVISDSQKQRLREIRFKHGHAATRQHGHSRTYQSWTSMKERCTDSSHKSYVEYGGRGISFCKKWTNFTGFLSDMGIRPEGKTLGRLRNNGNYTPKNCVWQTYKEQARNRRNSRILRLKGRRATIAEWAEITGITDDAISKRLAAGWSVKKSLTKPMRADSRRAIPC